MANDSVNAFLLRIHYCVAKCFARSPIASQPHSFPFPFPHSRPLTAQPHAAIHRPTHHHLPTAAQMQNSPSTIPIVRSALPSLHRHQYSPAYAIVRCSEPFVCALVPIENHISIYERLPFSRCSGRGDRYRCGGVCAHKMRRKEIGKRKKKNEKREQNELWMDGKYIVLCSIDIFDGMNVREIWVPRAKQIVKCAKWLWVWTLENGDGNKYCKFSCANSKGVLRPASTFDSWVTGWLSGSRPGHNTQYVQLFHSVREASYIFFWFPSFTGDRHSSALQRPRVTRTSQQQWLKRCFFHSFFSFLFLKSSEFAFGNNLQAHPEPEPDPLWMGGCASSRKIRFHQFLNTPVTCPSTMEFGVHFNLRMFSFSEIPFAPSLSLSPMVLTFYYGYYY